ncbi:MAG: hypothetical protein ACK5LP_07220 [Campylobacteraceae bacterium]
MGYKKIYMKFNTTSIFEEVINAKGVRGKGADVALSMIHDILIKISQRLIELKDKKMLGYLLQLGLITPQGDINMDEYLEDCFNEEEKQTK